MNSYTAWQRRSLTKLLQRQDGAENCCQANCTAKCKVSFSCLAARFYTITSLPAVLNQPARLHRSIRGRNSGDGAVQGYLERGMLILW
jgi:hypothetical protein